MRVPLRESNTKTDTNQYSRYARFASSRALGIEAVDVTPPFTTHTHRETASASSDAVRDDDCDDIGRHRVVERGQRRHVVLSEQQFSDHAAAAHLDAPRGLVVVRVLESPYLKGDGASASSPTGAHL